MPGILKRFREAHNGFTEPFYLYYGLTFVEYFNIASITS